MGSTPNDILLSFGVLPIIFVSYLKYYIILILDAEIVVPLKCLSNFWRSLDFPLINYEMELVLIWTKNLVISEIYETSEVPANSNGNQPNSLIHATAITGTTFQIKKC